MDAHDDSQHGRDEHEQTPQPAANGQGDNPQSVTHTVPSQAMAEWGVGGRLRGQDIRQLGRAVKEGWPIPPALRATVIELLAETIRDTNQILPRRLAAIKALIAADQINAKREATATSAETADMREAAASLRQALSTEAGRAALAALEALDSPPPAPQPPPAT